VASAARACVGTVATVTGQAVILTRSAQDCVEWAEQLRQWGTKPVIFPCTDCEILDSPALRCGLTDQVKASEWLVFTSRRGIQAFAALHSEWLDAKTRIAVVGDATADEARLLLGRVDLVGGGTAATLAESLLSALAIAAPAHVLIIVAENAGSVIEDRLSAAARSYARINVYRTVPKGPSENKRALSTLAAQNIFFASPSAITGFVNQIEMDIQAAIFTIGPTTTAAAQARGLAVSAEAREPSLAGLVEAMQ